MDVLRTTIQREFRNLRGGESERLYLYIKEIYEFALQGFGGRLPPITRRDAMALVFLIFPYIDESNIPRISSLDQVFRRKSPYCNIWVNDNVSLDSSTIAIKETIRMASNKLIADGIDFFPVPLSRVKETPLFLRDTAWFESKGQIASGLWEGDYFNTIVNDLYRNIRSCKFMLYELRLEHESGSGGEGEDEETNRIYSFQDVIHAVFDNREEAWEETLGLIKSSEKIGGFSHDEVILVLRYGIVFFDNYFPESDLPPGYQGILNKRKSPDNDEDDEDYTRNGKENVDISGIPEDRVHDALRRVGMARWYSYLYDCWNKLRRTYYWEEKTQKEIPIPDDSGLKGMIRCPLTRKHVYLFAKNLYLYWKAYDETDPSFSDRPLWSRIMEYSRQNIRAFILDKNDLIKFFDDFKYRITPTLRRFFAGSYERLSPSSPKDVEIGLVSSKSPGKFVEHAMSYYSYQMIVTLLPEIVHTTLIRKGVLSTYRPDYAETIKKDEVFRFIDGMPSDRTEPSPRRDAWPRVYPCNWIQQLSVYHRLYHSRITLVTGGTGVGKSRHSPKLFFYAMMMMFYNSTPRMICTQPRINPTKNAATGLADDLGCPIIVAPTAPATPATAAEVELLRKDYYIQYKYSEESYVPKPDRDIGYIRVSTDGSFLEMIRMNATLLTSLIPGTAKNVADLVLVDEAHEHNTNMDLIISIMRKALRINNTVRLVIVSATMDDDELRYRQFFAEFGTTIDHRIHLAEYGRPNLFRITDHYEPGVIRSFEDAENAGIRKVLSLSRNNDTGDVLFFSLGESDITRTIDLLNQGLPAAWIALPFFSKLPKDYQQIFNNFETESKRLMLPKTGLIPFIHSRFGARSGKTSSMATASLSALGMYKKFVIVATNIAEASITIDTLKVVVDTGFVKLATYDPKTGSNDLEPLPITESSRIQRRGRVGRVSDGDVYFLYKKGSRPEEQRFNITKENVIPRFLLQGALTISTIERENIQQVSFDELLDIGFTFHFIHPMEDKIARNDDYSVKRRGNDDPSNGYLLDHRKIVQENVVCINILRSGIVPSLSRRVALEELTVFDLIALILAHNHGKEVFVAVARVIISVRIHLVPCDIIFRGRLLALEEPSSSISAKDMKRPERIESTIEFLWREIEQEKMAPRPGLTPLKSRRCRVNLTFGSSREEIAALCLYHAAPINLGVKDGSRLINAFSRKRISSPPNTRAPETKYFVYLSSVNNTCQHLFALPSDAVDKRFLFDKSLHELRFA